MNTNSKINLLMQTLANSAFGLRTNLPGAPTADELYTALKGLSVEERVARDWVQTFPNVEGFGPGGRGLKVNCQYTPYNGSGPWQEFLKLTTLPGSPFSLSTSFRIAGVGDIEARTKLSRPNAPGSVSYFTSGHLEDEVSAAKTQQFRFVESAAAMADSDFNLIRNALLKEIYRLGDEYRSRIDFGSTGENSLGVGYGAHSLKIERVSVQNEEGYEGPRLIGEFWDAVYNRSPRHPQPDPDFFMPNALRSFWLGFIQNLTT